MIPGMRLSRRGVAALAAAVLSLSAAAPSAGAQPLPDIAKMSSPSALQDSVNAANAALASAQQNAANASSQAARALNLPPLPGVPVPTGATTTTKRFIGAAGLPREYTLVVPGNYNPNVAYPVIIGFGGWQHNADQTRGYERLEEAANGRAIVVYAQGVANAWGGAPYAKTSVDADVQYVRALLNDVARTHNIDRGRVYAAGLSNGGGMAAALACHAPDLVAGVAGVAGAYYDPTVSGCHGGDVPILLMHADNDDVVDYFGGVRHGAPYKSPRTVFYDQGVRNGCDMNAVTPRQQGHFTVFTPAGCRQRTEIVKIAGGGHTWFGNPSATEWTVRFFLG